MALSPQALRQQALRWLAQRDHSRAELRRKLGHAAAAAAATATAADPAAAKRPRRDGDTANASAGAGDAQADPEAPEAPEADNAADSAATDVAATIERVLEDLTAAGLLDDARAAEAVVSAKAHRLGARRLGALLRAKGLGAEAAAIATAHGSEFERACEVRQRRFGAPPADAREAARQARFLAGRGFDGDVIRRVIRVATAAESPEAG